MNLISSNNINIKNYYENKSQIIPNKRNTASNPTQKFVKPPVHKISPQYLKAMALISFKGKDYVENNLSIVVKNLFKNSNSFEMPNVKAKNDEAFKIIKDFSDKNCQQVTIKDNKDNIIAKIKQNLKNKLVIGFKVGEHPPTIQLKDADQTLLMTKGTVKSPNFEVSMYPNKKDVSFSGKLILPTGFRANTVEDVIADYFDKGLYKAAPVGRYADHIKNDYSMVITTGGFGKRLANIASINGSNKAAIPTAAKDRVIIHDIMDKFVGAKLINPYNPDFAFIPDHFLKEDGFIIGKSLRDGYIPANRPAILCPSDYISNIDFSKVIKEFEEKNAGIMLIASEIPTKDTNLYNLLNVKDNMQVEKFFVRQRHRSPDDFDFAKNKSGNFKDKYVASLPIFILHPKVLKELAQFTDGTDEPCKIGKNFMPAIIKKLNNNEILNEKGQPLKLFASLAETNKGNKAVFRDIGTFDDFIDCNKKVANGEMPDLSPSLVEEFKRNVDLDTGVICLDGSKDAFNAFMKNNGITEIKGDMVFVAND